MFDTVARIKAKYANMPPPEDYPLYGDFVEFKDEINGSIYVGHIFRHHFSANLANHVWDAYVNGTIMSVKQSEIIRIFRAKREQ